MISINPYLVFQGNCEEAFDFYKKAFRAQSLYVGYYRDVPDKARAFFSNAPDEKVLHATLQIDGNTVIMGNDNPEPPGQLQTSPARDFYLYVDVNDAKEATRVFEELSAGGNVIMPIAKTFWSPCYGILTDKFGIHWKITSHEEDRG